jgi:hypothetical protein
MHFPSLKQINYPLCTSIFEGVVVKYRRWRRQIPIATVTSVVDVMFSSTTPEVLKTNKEELLELLKENSVDFDDNFLIT